MRMIFIILSTLVPLLAEVGTITFIRGDVFYTRDNQVKTAKVGMKLEEKDRITTKMKSMTKILLNDKSAISLGSNSNFDIHEFLYDPKQKQAKMELQSNRGVFRVITGNISKIAPDRFKLKTKTLTIGIRGTIFSGILTPKSQKVFCEKGRIYVAGKGIVQELEKGKMTESVNGGAPGKPKDFTAADIAKIREETTSWSDKACEVNLDEL